MQYKMGSSVAAKVAMIKHDDFVRMNWLALCSNFWTRRMHDLNVSKWNDKLTYLIESSMIL